MIDGTVVINYLVDTNRDYAQVLEERDENGNLLVRYVYGHDLISQTINSATTCYHYDGSGSTRALTNGSEGITDTYTYDAFGNLLDKTGTTTNTYLFTGEFFDTNVGFYYLRARYMSPAIGRFVTMDMFAGFQRDPYSLHKYLYAHANPINRIDPSGYFDYKRALAALNVLGIIANISQSVYHLSEASQAKVGSEEWQQHMFEAQIHMIGAFCGGIGAAGGGMLLSLGTQGSLMISTAVSGSMVVAGTAIAAKNLIMMAVSSFIEGEGRDPSQDKKLSKGEIKKLKKAGFDIHDLKGGKGASRFDLFKDKQGNIYIKPKSGIGPGDPLGININDF